MPYTTPPWRNRVGRPEVLILGLFVFLGIASSLPGFSNAARSKSERPTSANPAPQDATVGVRWISLLAKDLIYDPVTQRIYASVPSAAGANGNSITPLDPVSGIVGSSVFIGSEPGKLAISDNSQYIYAALDGAASVRRFDIASQTASLQFSLGSSPFTGPYYVDDMAVVPGDPNAVTISRRNSGFSPGHEGVAIYDAGIPRSVTTDRHTGSNVIEFSQSSDTLYGYNNESTEFGFRTMAVSASGVTVTSVAPSIISGFGTDIRHHNGLIYSTTGRVIEPENLTLVGTYANVGNFAHVVPDSTTNRIYFLSGGFMSSTLTLKEYNLTTFVQTGSLTISGIAGSFGSFIKWGANGLAFRTTSGQVFLISTSAIIPTGPTPVPSPIQVANGVVRLPLITNDLVYDPGSQKVYATLPSAAGSFGNSIVPIAPETGLMGAPVFVGSEPWKLAISDNNQYIYIGNDGAGTVRKFDIASQTSGIQFPVGRSGGVGGTGIQVAEDIVVLPGSPNTIVVSRFNVGFSPRHEGVAVFDDGVIRSITTPGHTGSNVIEPSLNAQTIYGYNNETTEFGFRKMAISASGVAITSTVSNLITDFDVDIKHDNGVVYSSSRRAINPETGILLGTFTGVTTLAFVPDSSAGRIYFATRTGSSITIQVFNLNTFVPIVSWTIPNVNGFPFNLIKWGTNGLAFSTTDGQVYFVQTSLISTNEIQFSASSFTTTEGNARADVVVNRSTSNTVASVNYSTSDNAGLANCNVVNGVASSRCDYATAVGKLSFAAGETSKTISIPIVDDAYAEGSESFTITLSNATGTPLGAPASATVTITDNETSNGTNPIDFTTFFVRQQYVDFLGREPDPSGFAGWQNVINNCPAGDTTCDRIHVSSAFFRSPEFQGRGYFVYRFYPVAFGRKPEYVEFIPDLAKVSGFLSDAELEAAKLAFIAEFMSRQPFVAKFNGLDNTQYVDTLLLTAGITHPARDFWIAALGNGTRTRAEVLREICESTEIYNKYYNQAFVVMQYFGYLRRDPDSLYLDWIQVLDSTGDFRGMVNGFSNSLEYRFRFGP